MIYASIMRSLMTSFAMFFTVFELTKSGTDIFAQKKFSRDIFIQKFVTDTIN